MRVTYTSDKYNPTRSYSRYVRCDMDGSYHWCEVGTGEHTEKRLDYRQGIVNPAELPEEVRDRADALCGYFPSYVDWPVEHQERP